jgi:hypothetical protein
VKTYTTIGGVNGYSKSSLTGGRREDVFSAHEARPPFRRNPPYPFFTFSQYALNACSDLLPPYS